MSVFGLVFAKCDEHLLQPLAAILAAEGGAVGQPTIVNSAETDETLVIATYNELMQMPTLSAFAQAWVANHPNLRYIGINEI